MGSFFGLLILVITPPFQSPDEFHHFYRAYQVSEGKILSKKEGALVGDYLPLSLVEYISKFGSLPFQPQNHISPSLIWKCFDIPLEKNKLGFLDFRNTSLYSPIPYIPQAIGIFVGRMFDASPALLSYLGRLGNLVAWILLGYFSVKFAPSAKWFFALYLLSPMGLFQASSMSADAATNAICALMISFVLYLKFSADSKIKNLELLILLLLGGFLGLCKQGYIPIVFIFLLIPRRKFLSTTRYFLTFASLLLVSGVISVLWSYSVRHLFLPLRIIEGISLEGQMKFIVENPEKFLGIIVTTLQSDYAGLIQQFIGVLGWMDTYLPKVLYFLYPALLLLALRVHPVPNMDLGKADRCCLLFIWLAGTGLVLISQYLVFNPVGAPKIEGIHGRYFIPLASLLFLVFYSRRNLVPANRVVLINVGFALGAVLVLVATCRALTVRYYG